METLYIVWGLMILVILIALGFGSIDIPPPPEPPSSGVYSPSDSPYAPALSQQGTYRHPLHGQFPAPHLAIQYPQIPSSYSIVQAPSSPQPSPYQPRRLPIAQCPPQATTPLLSRDALVPKPVCYTPQVPTVPVVTDPRERPIGSALRVSGSPVVIEQPVARALQVPAAPIEVDPRERPVGSALRVPVVPIVIERPAARAQEIPVVRVVINPHEDLKSLRLKAKEEGDLMGKCFKERNEAKARND
ncbi:hypothetical protein BDR07DRAFT_1372185 [Suillus spraguei]|nr:hypothetical protein BDR07DRAFT_1372185 [Suillus spraguei]